MLQNADPTGEIQPDSQELLDLEEECYMMGPLIDKKLQDIDQQHATLEDLNLKILDAFQLYNNLMKESISKQTALINNSQINPQQMMGQLSMGVSSNGGINYAAAPPSLEANSLNFANKLNSLAAMNSNMPSMPNANNIPTNYIPTSLPPQQMQAPNSAFPLSNLGLAQNFQYSNDPGGQSLAAPLPNAGLTLGQSSMPSFQNQNMYLGGANNGLPTAITGVLPDLQSNNNQQQLNSYNGLNYSKPYTN
jgi:hypothetical protein